MSKGVPTPARPKQDELYAEVVGSYGPALTRFSRSYEADQEKRRDLLQDIHLQLWLSFKSYDGRCSLRTWIYRVAHNCGRSHISRESRVYSKLVDLGQLDSEVSKKSEFESNAEREDSLERLSQLIQQLKPIDRQVILLYLERVNGASIGDITGTGAFFTCFQYSVPDC